MESNKSAALASSLTGIICDVRIRRSAGEHRTRLTSANRHRRRHWPPDAMATRCREFVDSRLRRSPPDRASAVPYGQAGENAMRFPHLAHMSAGAHKLHSTPQQHRMNLNFGERVQPAADYRPLAYSSPEAVQTTGTVVAPVFARLQFHQVAEAVLELEIHAVQRIGEPSGAALTERHFEARIALEHAPTHHHGENVEKPHLERRDAGEHRRAAAVLHRELDAAAVWQAGEADLAARV